MPECTYLYAHIILNVRNYMQAMELVCAPENFLPVAPSATAVGSHCLGPLLGPRVRYRPAYLYLPYSAAVASARSSLKTTTHNISAYSARQLDALGLQLAPLQHQVFTGVSYAEFRRYVLYSPAWRTWLWVRRTPAGQPIGYLALHAFQKRLVSRQCIVFRMETGKLPAYRGKDLLLLRAIGRMIWVGLRYPAQASYFFATPVYPTPYALVAKYSSTIWPSRAHDTPPDKQQLLLELATDFGLPLLDPARPLIRRVSWITRDEAQGAPAWSARRNPHVAYFLQLNPDYARGFGLLTLAPTGAGALLGSFLRYGWSKMRRMLPFH